MNSHDLTKTAQSLSFLKIGDAEKAIEIGNIIISAKEGLAIESAIRLAIQQHDKFKNSAKHWHKNTKKAITEWALSVKCEGYIIATHQQLVDADMRDSSGIIMQEQLFVWGLAPKVNYQYAYELIPLLEVKKK